MKSHFLSIFSFILMLGASPLWAQNQVFDVHVDVNTAQISASSGLDYLDQLAPLIRDYLREVSWTEDRFEEHERIRLTVQVILTAVEGNRFNATFVIQSERPIYNTMLVTPLIVISDNNWMFTFNRNQSIIHDPFQFDGIATMLDFYAYMILGFDYDSFSELGGQEFFRQAQSVLEVANSAGAAGWGSSGSSRRTRFHLVNQMLNPNYEEFRKAFYQYHRQGLDRFVQNPDRARDNAIAAFQLLRQAQRQTTDTYAFDLLFATKYREFTAMFVDAEPGKRLEAFNLLSEMDNSHISEYEKLR